MRTHASTNSSANLHAVNGPRARSPKASDARTPSAAALCALALPLCLLSACAFAGGIEDEIESLIRAKKLGGARVGVVAMDAKTNAVLADIRGSEQFIPASNMKLLTTGAALATLGPDYSFRTELVHDDGRLILRGSGDPALGDPEVLSLASPALSVDDLLNSIAGAPAKAGLTSFREFIIDDRVFDHQYLHPTWNPANYEESYSAEVSGLNFHANTLWVFAQPSSTGQPTCTTEPSAPWLRIDTSKARNQGQGKNNYWLTRAEAGCYIEQGKIVRDATLIDGILCNTFELRGDVRAKAAGPTALTIRNVPSFFGNVLASRIIAAGTPCTVPATTSGTPGGVRFAMDSEDLSHGRVLAVVTTPIKDVVTRCNTDSENLYAESLLKLLGHTATNQPGSWANGAAALRSTLESRLGTQEAASLVIADGSGLSRDDRVTPHALAQWLCICEESSWGQSFVTSLATPGKGTLRERFRSKKLTNQVYAKSGFINGVRSLSGYVVDAGAGETLVFSILINDLPTGSNDVTSSARELHEDIVDALDNALVRRSANAKPQHESTKVGG